MSKCGVGDTESSLYGVNIHQYIFHYTHMFSFLIIHASWKYTKVWWLITCILVKRQSFLDHIFLDCIKNVMIAFCMSDIFRWSKCSASGCIGFLPSFSSASGLLPRCLSFPIVRFPTVRHQAAQNSFGRLFPTNHISYELITSDFWFLQNAG